MTTILEIVHVDPKAELYRYGTKILGGKSGGSIVARLLKTYGSTDLFMTRRILQLSENHPNPKAYIFKVLKNHKELLDRDKLDRAQADNWRPIRGRYPLIDYTHPRQPYYILSDVDKKKIYMDQHRVEELVNNQRDDLGMI